MNGIDVGLLIISLTLLIVLATRSWRTPSPVILAVAGIVAGVFWNALRLPEVTVPPNHVLFLFLPPLLTTAAYALPLGAFRRNLSSIGFLAVGLVLATMVATAAVAHGVVGMAWAPALVLGAIISPPDPVAATSVSSATGLGHRLVIVLEGEGLVNDAVAIVAYGLALHAALTGEYSWSAAGLSVIEQVPTGVLVGLVIGWGSNALRRRIDNVTIEAGLSLLVPYLVYEIADRVGASGVLAVVTFGFMVQRQANAIATPAARLAARTVWSAVRFASSSLVFFLLGMIMGQSVFEHFTMVGLMGGAAVAGTAIVVRLAWMYLVPHLTRLGFGRSAPVPSWRELTVLGWSGMRGVVSLALALALPGLPRGGLDDPRSTIVLITFVVIVATLVLQGMTLLPLVSWLGVGDPAREGRDERETRALALEAGVAALARLAEANPERGDRIGTATQDFLSGEVGVARSTATSPQAFRALDRALEAQRRVVTERRDAGEISEALAERLKTELDVDDMRLSGDAARLTGGAE